MFKIVDARGLSCPQPVINAKKAIEEHGSIIIIVDNKTALENVKRMGNSKGMEARIEEMDDGTFRIYLSGDAGDDTGVSVGNADLASGGNSISGPSVIVFADNKMGRGDDELGAVLIKAYIHTLSELDNLPDIMIFYNAGVKLAVRDSDVIDDIKKLEGTGVEILVCGTCVNYFEISDNIGAGKISNMYDIAGILSQSGRIIMP